MNNDKDNDPDAEPLWSPFPDEEDALRQGFEFALYAEITGLPPCYLGPIYPCVYEGEPADSARRDAADLLREFRRRGLTISMRRLDNGAVIASWNRKTVFLHDHDETRSSAHDHATENLPATPDHGK